MFKSAAKVQYFFESRKNLSEKMQICGVFRNFCAKKGYITLQTGVCNTSPRKHLEKCHIPVYLCAKFPAHMKIELQLIAAFVLSIGGLILLFCGLFIDPQGQIHETLLVAFGETATFAGALFGIDYVYKKKK